MFPTEEGHNSVKYLNSSEYKYLYNLTEQWERLHWDYSPTIVVKQLQFIL